ncbi:MAG TPA: dipeptide ABC transporter ATP-binding protein [Burkholderiaceae bacterium]|nr:dipeptide ABC transporter ATP-binding protein [Burkholderiaceae bacterium]
MNLLEVQNLTVSFGDKPVVHGINFAVKAGERVALVGESGSGKTVTALSLLRLALNAQLSGSALFRSQQTIDLLQVPEQQMRDMRGRDIAMIFQEPMTALNPLFTIGNQIAEVLLQKQAVSSVDIANTAIKLIASTGINDPERCAKSYPHQLSGGQRQRAMIAMALACQPKLLLADEPTTALDVSLRLQILELLSDLQKQNGMAVVLITHDLNLVRKFADRIIVMEGGHIVEQGTVSDVFTNPQHTYTRKLLDSKPVRDVVESSKVINQQDKHTTIAQQPSMQARDVRVSYPTALAGFKGWFTKGEYVAVKHANFELMPGQTLGVIGESGSGKTTLALAASGLQSFDGLLQINEQQWGQGKVQDRGLRKVVQVVFQDPFSSLSPRMTIAELVGEGLLVHSPEFNQMQRQTKVLQALLEVGLTEAQFPNLLSRYPHEFSGGQRQRIAIARALIVEPQILVLDEPTSALDVTIQKQVLQLLQRLQRERGLSYLLITHDIDVIRAMAHHVLVMRHGEIVESGSIEQILQQPKNDYTALLVNH